MAADKLTYEGCRLKRLEENKKRMEDLNLSQLSQSFRNSILPPKPYPMKRPWTLKFPKGSAPTRRSTRVADKPYADAAVKHFGITRRWDFSNRVYASDEARSYAKLRAEELKSGLESGFPSFVKPMLQPHVSRDFWLDLPGYFCRTNVSRSDEVITLVDEEGDEHRIMYVATSVGTAGLSRGWEDSSVLSRGWEDFSVAHDLVDGDALVFQLIRPKTFKVYIVRVRGLEQGNKL